MEKDTHITEVMFRYDTTKGFKGTIFAVLPHQVDTLQGDVTTYQHVGQHSTGDYNVCLQQSRPATEAEFADLKKEMENLGYNLKVVKKRNYDKYLKSYYEARGIVNNLLQD
jgi:hypothetical protein